MIAPADCFSPWRESIDLAERLAWFRSMRAIAGLTPNPLGDAFAGALHHAKTDAEQLKPALRRLDALAALDRRAVPCSFAALHRSNRSTTR